MIRAFLNLLLIPGQNHADGGGKHAGSRCPTYDVGPQAIYFVAYNFSVVGNEQSDQ